MKLFLALAAILSGSSVDEPLLVTLATRNRLVRITLLLVLAVLIDCSAVCQPAVSDSAGTVRVSLGDVISKS